MKKGRKMIQVLAASAVIAACLTPAVFLSGQGNVAARSAVNGGWNMDNNGYYQDFSWSFDNGYPKTLEQLEAQVDLTDPRSVAACAVASGVRLTDSEKDGDAMLKYLCCRRNTFDGTYEAGWYNKAGDFYDYKSSRRKWVPRSYFEGGTAGNGYTPSRPWTIYFQYDADASNEYDSVKEKYGLKSIYYRIKSKSWAEDSGYHDIVLYQYPGEDRWWVTNMKSFTMAGVQPTAQGSNDDGFH